MAGLVPAILLSLPRRVPAGPPQGTGWPSEARPGGDYVTPLRSVSRHRDSDIEIPIRFIVPEAYASNLDGPTTSHPARSFDRGTNAQGVADVIVGYARDDRPSTGRGNERPAVVTMPFAPAGSCDWRMPTPQPPPVAIAARFQRDLRPGSCSGVPLRLRNLFIHNGLSGALRLPHCLRRSHREP